jgi:hypothetical protein
LDYDANGNMTMKNTYDYSGATIDEWTYSYDPDDMMIKDTLRREVKH